MENKQPDYKARIEVPAWINQTKNGDKYISIKLFGTTINLFRNEPPKPKIPSVEDI